MKAKNWLKKRNVIDKRLEGNADGESVIHWQQFDSNLFESDLCVKSGTLRELQPSNTQHLLQNLTFRVFQIQLTFTSFCVTQDISLTYNLHTHT